MKVPVPWEVTSPTAAKVTEVRVLGDVLKGVFRVSALALMVEGAAMVPPPAKAMKVLMAALRPAKYAFEFSPIRQIMLPDAALRKVRYWACSLLEKSGSLVMRTS